MPFSELWLPSRQKPAPIYKISLISLRSTALGVLFLNHGQFGLTCGKKAHYSGDLSEHAIFWLPTQDRGNQPFSIKGLKICAPLNQCSYKKLCGNFASCLSSSRTQSTTNSSKTAIRKQKTIEPQRERSRGRREKQAVCGSISALLAHRFAVLARPLRPSAESLTYLWPPSTCWWKE